jgi:hypothetical protein
MTIKFLETNTRINTLRNNIESIERGINNLPRQITRHIRDIGDYRQQYFRYKKVLIEDARLRKEETRRTRAKFNQEHPHFDSEAYLRAVTDSRRSIRGIRKWIAEQNEGISDTKTRLARRQQELAKELLKPQKEHEIDVDTLETQINKLPEVSEATITLTNTEIQIDCKCLNIIMSPADSASRDAVEDNLSSRADDDGIYDYINDVDIPLDPLTFRLTIPLNSLTEHTWRIVKATGIRAYDDQYIAHPHWISETSPCFGDFGGPLQETMAQADIITAITLLILFLQQYDYDDSAGRHYYRWWRHYNCAGSVRSRAYTYTEPDRSDVGESVETQTIPQEHQEYAVPRYATPPPQDDTRGGTRNTRQMEDSFARYLMDTPVLSPDQQRNFGRAEFERVRQEILTNNIVPHHWVADEEQRFRPERFQPIDDHIVDALTNGQVTNGQVTNIQELDRNARNVLEQMNLTSGPTPPYNPGRTIPPVNYITNPNRRR